MNEHQTVAIQPVDGLVDARNVQRAAGIHEHIRGRRDLVCGSTQAADIRRKAVELNRGKRRNHQVAGDGCRPAVFAQQDKGGIDAITHRGRASVGIALIHLASDTGDAANTGAADVGEGVAGKSQAAAARPGNGSREVEEAAVGRDRGDTGFVQIHRAGKSNAVVLPIVPGDRKVGIDLYGIAHRVIVPDRRNFFASNENVLIFLQAQILLDKYY